MHKKRLRKKIGKAYKEQLLKRDKAQAIALAHIRTLQIGSKVNAMVNGSLAGKVMALSVMCNGFSEMATQYKTIAEKYMMIGYDEAYRLKYGYC